jgi:xanthine dehydrogenase molybdopterin-binding subunit B
MTECTSRTLPAAREALVAAIVRDTPGAEQRRLVKVLDILLAWSAARGARLAFRTDATRSGVLAFQLEGTRTVFWSAQVTRGAGPALELFPPSGASLPAEVRALVRQTLNVHSRRALTDGDRLRIGFGALKNDAARAAVLALMARLLATPGDTRTSAEAVA